MRNRTTSVRGLWLAIAWIVTVGALAQLPATTADANMDPCIANADGNDKKGKPCPGAAERKLWDQTIVTSSAGAHLYCKVTPLSKNEIAKFIAGTKPGLGSDQEKCHKFIDDECSAIVELFKAGKSTPFRKRDCIDQSFMKTMCTEEAWGPACAKPKEDNAP